MAHLDILQLCYFLPADVGGGVVVCRGGLLPLGRRVGDGRRVQRARRRLRRSRYGLDRGVGLVLIISEL